MERCETTMQEFEMILTNDKTAAKVGIIDTTATNAARAKLPTDLFSTAILSDTALDAPDFLDSSQLLPSQTIYTICVKRLPSVVLQ